MSTQPRKNDWIATWLRSSESNLYIYLYSVLWCLVSFGYQTSFSLSLSFSPCFMCVFFTPYTILEIYPTPIISRISCFPLFWWNPHKFLFRQPYSTLREFYYRSLAYGTALNLVCFSPLQHTKRNPTNSSITVGIKPMEHASYFATTRHGAEGGRLVYY